ARLDRAAFRHRRPRTAAAPTHTGQPGAADARSADTGATTATTARRRPLRRTKVVATLGPASGQADMIARLFVAGADVFRINMSHTPHDRMREMVKAIRKVESDYNRPIGILVDLQGPKLRVGAFAGGSAMLDNG